MAALAGLAAADRDVLVLIAWEQLTYEEAGRCLGVPVGTVRSRLHRARAKVREALALACPSTALQEILNNE
jgi:RNA polymerase sigma-70 factor (ECF subfamily)